MKLSKTEIDSIAIGKFDGFHLGHQKIFQELTKNSAILIIDKEKSSYIIPKKFLTKFTDIQIFRYLLTDIKSLNGKNFIRKLENDFPNLKNIVIGYDFQFGNGRNCSISDLKKYSDFKVKVVDEVKIANISIHSGEIIRRLRDGDIKFANILLGRKFEIIGKHINGQGVGKKDLVPTINISYEKFISPKDGVYLTETFFKNRQYFSISFLGIRETTDRKFSFESHILNDNIDEKDCGEVRTKFIKYIRSNRKFSDLQSLKIQILKDIKIAKYYLQN